MIKPVVVSQIGRRRFALAAAALLWVSWGCGPAAPQADDDAVDPGRPDAAPRGAACQTGENHCAGDRYEVCEGGRFRLEAECAPPQTCAPDLGCVDCYPGVRVCRGDDVYTCGDDGTPEQFVETCPFESCHGGSCGGDCASGAELIYLLDAQANLYSFDPRRLPGSAFQLIGHLGCPGAAPFSMSVDRSATAWVLYRATGGGQLFEVSTADASCRSTSFATGQQGFVLFGMGFVADSAGSSAETLFVSNLSAGTNGRMLGSIAFPSLTVSAIGPLDPSEVGPELTGTGAGELYGYFPGQTNSFVAQIDKTTGANTRSWPLPPLGAAVRAWAFAHWGGQFYIFVATQSSGTSAVQVLDPATGQVSTALADTGKTIVGAGVSTCAPIVVN